MAISMQRRASFTVELPVSTARTLFTPEGERAWAGEEWDPQYPDPSRKEGAGTVFVTTEGGKQTVWVMVDASAMCVRYVRTTANVDAGTVTVNYEEAGPERTVVTAIYDVTALGSEGEAALDVFAQEFATFIRSWATEIEQLGTRPS
jgi:hypothetical protein